MYPAAFRYYRAATLEEAASILSQAGDEARPLAGGQSLIPLMKLRLVRPELLVDLNSIPGLSSIKSEQEVVRIGASAAVQLTMADRSTCEQAHIYLGCVGLVPLHATAAEAELRGRELTKERISAAAEAAMEAAAPHSDMRGSAEYKKVLVKHVVK